jgi:hypothetical protein
MIRNSIALLVLVYVTGSVLAFGGKEKDKAQPAPVEASGRVRLTGNSPMAVLVITGENREWIVEPEEQQKLMHLQQQTVTVRGKEYYEDRVFANGSPAGRHYYLKDITGIKVNQP